MRAAANRAAKRMSHVHHYKPTPRHVVVVCLVGGSCTSLGTSPTQLDLITLLYLVFLPPED
jgi:hypothetical protein